MRSILLFSLSFFFININSVQAQQPFFKIRKVSHKGDTFEFPVFSSKTDVNTSNKINNYLQLGELHLLEYGANKHIFENVVPPEDMPSGGMENYGYEIIQNTNKLLSVKTFQEICGGGCMFPHYYYHFNAQNGDVILLTDIISSDLYEDFRKMVIEKRKAVLSTTFEDFKRDESDDEQEKFELEDFDYILESFETDNLKDFYFENDTLYIDGFNLFKWHQRPIGAENVAAISLNELKTYLNDYGKVLLGFQKGNIKRFHSKSFGQVYYGKIGKKQEVVFFFREWSEGYTEGFYAYNKYGKGIELGIEIKGNELLITEYGEGDKTAIINLKLEGKVLKGTWENTGKTKSLPVRLKRK